MAHYKGIFISWHSTSRSNLVLQINYERDTTLNLLVSYTCMFVEEQRSKIPKPVSTQIHLSVEILV